jgi:hypothetical protein
MMRVKDSLARAVLLTCVLCFPLQTHVGNPSAQYDPHPLRAVESRLREYLTKRVLVFRKSEIARHHIRFDSRGRLATESGQELKARPNAILFMGLTLNPDHLVILGEAARIPPGTPQLSVSRHHREFRLVTCTITLDIPPDEMTFMHAIRILCQVFLTREEFERAES